MSEDRAVQEIRLLVVDDHAMFREGLGGALEREPDMTVVAKCESATLALAKLDTTQPSLILLDFDLGSERALDFIIEAKRRGFEGRILVVTAGVSYQEAVQLVEPARTESYTSTIRSRFCVASSVRWRTEKSGWRRTISSRCSTAWINRKLSHDQRLPSGTRLCCGNFSGSGEQGDRHPDWDLRGGCQGIHAPTFPKIGSAYAGSNRQGCVGTISRSIVKRAARPEAPPPGGFRKLNSLPHIRLGTPNYCLAPPKPPRRQDLQMPKPLPLD